MMMVLAGLFGRRLYLFSMKYFGEWDQVHVFFFLSSFLLMRATAIWQCQEQFRPEAGLIAMPSNKMISEANELTRSFLDPMVVIGYNGSDLTDTIENLCGRFRNLIESNRKF